MLDRIALLDKMRTAPVLRRLGLGELDRLASRSRVRDLAPGETLIEEGEPGQEVYLLLAGRVAVRKRIGDSESTVIAVRGEADWIGEMALLGDLPRWASVTSEGPARVLEVPRDVVLGAVSGHPDAAMDLLRTTSERLRESDAQLIDVLTRKSRDLAASNRRLRNENVRLRGELDDCTGFEAFVGASPHARRVREAARRAARTDLPVLLLGETGTGKEVLARAIHAGTDRAERPFVAVNCAIFNETLLESELFGHARGAFTGASSNKRGLVEAADGGTLFLDEISDMPQPLQGALLRFLELGEFRRLGETSVRHARVRVIAATHGDLDEATASGRFRRDLLFRLDVMRIAVPPLRERPSDIPLLIAHFSERIACRLGVKPLRVAGSALEVLSPYCFPGNVRELINELERLFATLEPGATATARDLSPKIVSGDPVSLQYYGEAVRAFKARLLSTALEESGGNRALAARRLGVHQSNLSRMIRDLDVRVEPRPDPAEVRT